MEGEDVRLILARLEGFLKAFEVFNDKANHGCSFEVYQIPKAADVSTTLAAYFKLKQSDFRVEQLADFVMELQSVFARFLFLFQNPVGGHKYGDYLVDPRKSFALMSEHGREGLLDYLAGIVCSLGTAETWRVVTNLGCEALREWCFQEGIVLVLPTQLCLLHFGVSD